MRAAYLQRGRNHLWWGQSEEKVGDEEGRETLREKNEDFGVIPPKILPLEEGSLFRAVAFLFLFPDLLRISVSKMLPFPALRSYN